MQQLLMLIDDYIPGEDGLKSTACELTAYRFILCKDMPYAGEETLVVSDMYDYGLILAIYHAEHSGQCFENVIDDFGRDPHSVRSEMHNRYARSIIAMGGISRDGRIVSWDSPGFKIVTPNDIRPRLIEILRNIVSTRTT